MRILTFTLYLVCFVSIGWSILFFAGPIAIKWAINTFSDGKVKVQNVKVLPKLDIEIGSVEFVLDKSSMQHNKFASSRAVKLSWSLFDKQPFLTLTAGPTEYANIFTTEGFKITTLNFRNMNFGNLDLIVDLERPAANKLVVANQAIIKGLVTNNMSKINNVILNISDISSDSNYGGEIANLSLSSPGISLSKFTIDDTNPVYISASDWVNERFAIENVNVEILKFDYNTLEGFVHGFTDAFDISIDKSFWGKVPKAKYEASFVADLPNLNFFVESKADFDVSVGPKIYSEINTQINLSQIDQNKKCFLSGHCKVNNVDLNYTISVDDEWLKGKAYCSTEPCSGKKIDNLLESSNTFKVFEKLQSAKIFNPLILAYLYSYFLNGVETETGHQIYF